MIAKFHSIENESKFFIDYVKLIALALNVCLFSPIFLIQIKYFLFFYILFIALPYFDKHAFWLDIFAMNYESEILPTIRLMTKIATLQFIKRPVSRT